jgi:hypothetical protein
VKNGVTENRRETQNSVQKAEKMSDTDFTTKKKKKKKNKTKKLVLNVGDICVHYI